MGIMMDIGLSSITVHRRCSWVIMIQRSALLA